MNATHKSFVENRRAWVEERKREGVEGVYKAQALALPLPPSFNDALRVPRAERPVIAQLMRRSASGVDIEMDIATVVPRLEAAGVSALAIHTDEEHFGGSYHDILAAAQCTSLPILCMDLVLDPVQITMARAHGAAAVVLDAGILSDKELRALFRHALDLGLDVLVTVQNATELARASRIRRGSSESAGIRIFGINIELSGDTAADVASYERLAPGIPEHAVGVVMHPVNSGSWPRLEAMGYDVMMGESDLLEAADLEEAVYALAGAPMPSLAS